jgi:hypothetical protein
MTLRTLLGLQRDQIFEALAKYRPHHSHQKRNDLRLRWRKHGPPAGPLRKQRTDALLAGKAWAWCLLNRENPTSAPLFSRGIIIKSPNTQQFLRNKTTQGSTHIFRRLCSRYTTTRTDRQHGESPIEIISTDTKLQLKTGELHLYFTRVSDNDSIPQRKRHEVEQRSG